MTQRTQYPLIGLLQDVQRQMADDLHDRLGKLGYEEIRPAHGCVFGNMRPHGVRLTDIADRARITKQSVGEIVSNLEDLGYVERIPDPEDKRAKLVRLTPRGGRDAIDGIEQRDDGQCGPGEREHDAEEDPQLAAAVDPGRVEVDRCSTYTAPLVTDLLGLQTGWVWLVDAETNHIYSAAARNLPPYLQEPDVYLALDPEFSMKRGGRPGERVGTYDAADINWASQYLAELVTQHNLPPKVFVVHRFTRPMVTNTSKITLDPRVQIVMHMDGWGWPSLKKESYRRYIYQEPVQFTGFKLFYRNDTKAGHPLMTPAEVLMLEPKPVYIQYQ